MLELSPVVVLFSIIPNTHTPVFPNYDPWSEDLKGQLYLVQPRPSNYVDARYWNPSFTLPSLMDRDWATIMPGSQIERDVIRSWQEWDDGQRVLVPNRNSISWIVAYYAPIGMVITDNRHHRPFRTGDIPIDAPISRDPKSILK